MTDYKDKLKRLVDGYLKGKMPKTVNGYILEYTIEIFNIGDYRTDLPGSTVCVMMRCFVYSEVTDRIEEQTEHGLKTKWVTTKKLARQMPGQDAETNGHIIRAFHYNEEWLNGDHEYKNESTSHYIFSKAPKKEVSQIRDCMKGFVSDCVQYCVDLEKGWYK